MMMMMYCDSLLLSDVCVLTYIIDELSECAGHMTGYGC
jgi:hypothetical protein